MEKISMPANLANGYHGPQVEAHEERLQRVESTLQEVVAQNATQNVKLDTMKERSEDQTKLIIEKIDSGLKGINARLEETHTEVKQTKAKVEEHGTRLSEIETKVAAEEKAAQGRKKAALWVFVGVGGVLLEKLGEMLWAWLSR